MQELRNLKIKYNQLENKLTRLATVTGQKLYSNMTNKMEELFKRVAAMIPPFSGEEGTGLSSAVKTFLIGCENAKATIKTAEEQGYMMKAVLMRLYGDAFELINSSEVKTVDELIQLIEDNYCRSRTLDAVSDELKCTNQRQGETLHHFARRLTSLYTEAKQIASKI